MKRQRSFLVFRIKSDAYGINAIPLPSGFAWSIIKYMTKMASAIGTQCFCTDHAVRSVPMKVDSIFGLGHIKAAERRGFGRGQQQSKGTQKGKEGFQIHDVGD